MKNRNKKLVLALLLAGSVAMLATGCDKLKKEPETEEMTEAPTEAPTETEPPTETETETEPPTETETETEPETQPKNLTPEEEKAGETEYDQLRSLYAMDDINVRSQPDSGNDGNIFSSFVQGDKVTVVGETPNWYKVDVEDFDDYGYVSKQFISEQEVAPKTDEERQKAIEQELSGQTVPVDSDNASGSADTASSADAEYNVSAYAESFPIVAATGANLRKTPSQDGEIIATIGSDTSVTALGETDRWYKVDFDGTIGYVNKNLFNAD